MQKSLAAAIATQDEGLELPPLDRLRAHFGLSPATVWTLRAELAERGYLRCLNHHLFDTVHPKHHRESTGADRGRD
ncbi:hypothetical protein ACIRG5_45705 [Lentzea sp. NPDC102401]|uniref:hypothetical protein n=1 Tax=Lentzea sp. NPDC102401 TaxID=3364128 RepID=UPI00381BEA35